MNDPLFERLCELRPRLATHIRLLAQTYRGERWYVLADEAHGRYVRFNARAYAAIGRFDGRITLGDLHGLLADNVDALTQSEIVGLVLQLANMDALAEALPEDVEALTGQGAKKGKNGRSFNPLAIRFPLLDPDTFLDRMLPWVAPLFSKTAAVLWAACIVAAVILGIANTNELTSAFNANLLAPTNLLLAWLVFTVLKVMHEFAHAFAVKHWGGEVHEMGITLLVLAPVPYVDASASWAFQSKYRRALVGAAGIFVELWIAALALIVFLGVEPGMLRDAAINAMLIGSLSTLLINGNPLLRFDGYYVLQDLLEVPNLSSRSSRYLGYIARRYGLGIEDARSPVTARGERGWLLGYGLAAGAYRLFILCVIGLFLASQYLVVGVAIITWVVIMQVLLPAAKAVWFVLREKRLSGRRPLAIARLAALPVAAGLLVALVPVSTSTVAHGIVWLPQQAQLYAGSDGFVREILVADGTEVAAGTPLFALDNPDLLLRRQVVTARLAELDARWRADQFTDRTASEVAVEERRAIVAELATLDQQIAGLHIASPHAGVVVIRDGQRLQGRFISTGELLAHVVPPGELVVRSVVAQRDIGRLRSGVVNVDVRLAERLADSIEARIIRETPAGRSQLPSRALARAGGGKIATEVADDSSTRTTQDVFTIDLALPANTQVSGIGGRAYVRYQHPREPLLNQWHNRIRQLVLRRLAV